MGRIFSRFLDENGDGSGNINAIGDYSVTPQKFYIKAPANQSLILTEIMVAIRDNGAMNLEKYGSMAELTNGISMVIKEVGITVKTVVDDFIIKNNADWVVVCEEHTFFDDGGMVRMGKFRIDCEKFGAISALRLDGIKGDEIGFNLNDNFSALISQRFIVRGYITRHFT